MILTNMLSFGSDAMLRKNTAYNYSNDDRIPCKKKRVRFNKNNSEHISHEF